MGLESTESKRTAPTLLEPFPSLEPGFVSELFDTPEQFLSALATWDRRWQGLSSDWVFRGQADSEWSLLPHAHRPTCCFNYGAKLAYAPDENRHELHQLQAEFDLVRNFARELDRQGLVFPTESSRTWREFMAMVGSLIGHNGTVAWPPAEVAPLFALAQHHGVPTRLLDWTLRPFVAAYFAAIDAAKRPEISGNPEKRIAVWGLSSARASALLMGDLRKQGQPQLTLVHPPRSSNANLLAQDGVFSLISRTDGLPATAYLAPPLDHLISTRLAEFAIENGRSPAPLLRRLELSVEHIGRLLRLLATEGASGTRLYPGLEGAVRGMSERAYWDLGIAIPGD